MGDENIIEILDELEKVRKNTYNIVRHYRHTMCTNTLERIGDVIKKHPSFTFCDEDIRHMREISDYTKIMADDFELINGEEQQLSNIGVMIKRLREYVLNDEISEDCPENEAENIDDIDDIDWDDSTDDVLISNE